MNSSLEDYGKLCAMLQAEGIIPAGCDESSLATHAAVWIERNRHELGEANRRSAEVQARIEALREAYTKAVREAAGFVVDKAILEGRVDAAMRDVLVQAYARDPDRTKATLDALKPGTVLAGTSPRFTISDD